MGIALRFRTYAEAGTLGAVAAVAVLGAIVAIGGITVTGAPAEGRPAAAEVQTAATTGFDAAADVPAAAAPDEAAATDENVALDDVADVALSGATEAVPAAGDAIDEVTTGALPAKTQDPAPPGDAAATIADHSHQGDEGTTGLPLPDRLSTTALAIADTPVEHAAPEPSAAEAARMEAADATDATPDAPAAQASSLAYAGTAAAPPPPADDPIPVITAAADAPPATADGTGDDPPTIQTASIESPAEDTATVPAEKTATADPDLRIVAGLGVNVRSGPSLSKGKLFALKGGAKVTLTGDEDHGWLKVTDAKGRSGWIYGDYLHT